MLTLLALKGNKTMDIRQTGVTFQTDDRGLQQVFDLAEAKLKQNLRDFAGHKVLVEGGGYNKIWLETQPMGGEMYAKRDMEAAANNQLLFMAHQRADGRIPGSIMVQDGKLIPQFNKFQGFCFPAPALNMYYWLGKDREYLKQLKAALEGFDRYLWQVRDSDGDGCLESWCVTDTGEDKALRYGDAPFWWEGETPPGESAVVPMASMDIMSFSYSARETLAHISGILGNGREGFWQDQATAVRGKIREHLWDERRGACYDRDKSGRVMDILTHNNLRCMYWHAFFPDMAARFVRAHLLDPREFWTPFPLPSIAANDPMFRSNPGNDWSGQPQGLTWQRAITALENYGFYNILPLLGERLFQALGRDRVFTQQFDPFTGRAAGGTDGYGPTMLAALEYLSRLHGVHLQGEELWWGAWGTRETVYEQRWGDSVFRIVCDAEQAEAFIDGRQVFKTETGVRTVTDHQGSILRKISLI